MAQNEVAKISVGIEAKVDGLAADMKKAESTVKNGAKNIEKSVESAASKMERSWTEAFSKIGVIMQVADMAKRAVDALTGAFRKLTEDGVGAGQRVSGALKAIEDAGIPVISQGLAIGRALRDQLDGTAEELANIAKEMERLARFNEKLDKQMGMGVAANALKEQLSLTLRLGRVVDAEGNRRLKVHEEVGIRRIALIKSLDAQVIASGKGRNKVAQDTADKILEEFDRVSEIQNRRMGEEILIAERAEDDKIDAMKRAEDKKVKIAAEADQKIADKKAADDKKMNELKLSNAKDIESKILQMELKAAGKNAEAAQESIRRDYEKRMETATGKQKELLGELRGLEMAAAEADPAEPAAPDGGGGGTTSIATAIGTFSMGIASPELKESEKQTALLTKVVEELQSDVGGGSGFVLAT